jgi:2-polyprenyl-3-methyl-5-hydroxy-6-metoxy-1,4-benzoquinol methylase
MCEPSSFPVINGGYDTVVCLNVIEHVADDRRALANILEVLAPGGRAIILVPQVKGISARSTRRSVTCSGTRRRR